MGLLSTAMFGAAAGAGETGAKGYLQQDLEQMRQQLTAEREARNIRLTGEQTRQTQAEKPEIMPAGSTIQRPNQPNFQAPEKPQSEEEKAVMRAHANYYNSAARAAAAKEPKATMPKIIPLKDEQGNVIAVLDENTGAVGTPRPGTPAKDATGAPWYTFGMGKGEPGKPAVPSGLDWVGPDRQPIPGIHVYYPDMVKRGVGASGASPSAEGSATPVTAKNFWAKPQAAPERAPINTPPQSPPQPQYAPPPDSQAAQIVARRNTTLKEAKDRRDAESRAVMDRTMAARGGFEADKARLTPQQLLSKYGSGDVNSLLSDEQKAILYRYRNPRS